MCDISKLRDISRLRVILVSYVRFLGYIDKLYVILLRDIVKQCTDVWNCYTSCFEDGQSNACGLWFISCLFVDHDAVSSLRLSEAITW